MIITYNGKSFNTLREYLTLPCTWMHMLVITFTIQFIFVLLIINFNIIVYKVI